MDFDGSGVLRRQDLLGAGWTDDEVRARLRNGELVALRPGAYLRATQRPSKPEQWHELAIRAALPDLAQEVVVSHLSAAVVWGVPVWGLPLDRVTATRARRSGARRTSGVHLRAAALGPDEVDTVDGVTVTAVARTVVDIARSYPFEPAVCIADGALFRNLTTPADLQEAVQRASGRPGCPQARRVIAFADGLSEGVGESRSRVAMMQADLPAPVLQWPFAGPDGRPLGRVDFWWPDFRVVGEFDGRVKYGDLLAPGQSPGDAVIAEKAREDRIREEDVRFVRWGLVGDRTLRRRRPAASASVRPNLTGVAATYRGPPPSRPRRAYDRPVSVLDRLPVTAAPTMRRLAVANLVAQVGIMVTGVTVRVTGSGLGCPEFPQCFPGSMIPVSHADVAPLHQWVEFGNRMLTFVLVAIAGLVLLAALGTRPRRRRLTVLAAVMPIGIVVQALIGGFTVLTDLAWGGVSLHFMASALLVWLSVALVRATGEGDGPARAIVPRAIRRLVALSSAVLAALLVAGTLVTAAGPHAGDAETPRLALGVEATARLHTELLFGYLGLLVGLGFALHAVAAPAPVVRRFRVLIVVVLAQGAIGGMQYAIGVPEALVVLHVLGAGLVTAAAAALWFATTERGPAAAPAPTRATEAALDAH